MLSQKINEIKKLSKISPIIVSGIPSKMFLDSVVIDGNIPSSELGIVNTKDGLKYPNWYLMLKNYDEKYLIIDFVDNQTEYEQGKFYELLKYKEITNVALPKNTGIIVIAKDIKNVAVSIKNLCMIY